jgi:hypothetical protein
MIKKVIWILLIFFVIFVNTCSTAHAATPTPTPDMTLYEVHVQVVETPVFNVAPASDPNTIKERRINHIKFVLGKDLKYFKKIAKGKIVYLQKAVKTKPAPTPNKTPRPK